MMFTCAPLCADPSHAHARLRRTRSARVTSKAVKNRRGKLVAVDMHCHYLNRDVAAKVAHLNPAQYEPSVQFANSLTRDVNVKQMQERGAKLSTIEVRLKDMDRMGIDVQAVSPAPNQCIYWSEPDLGRELARMANERLAEIAATWPERFVAMGTVPLQNAGMAVAELEYCVKKLGMRGVEILPNVNGKDLT